MADNQKGLQHFILTRFNIRLWNRDKEGCKVRSLKWLEHRFFLFEHYCLPSIKNQTFQDFEWIVLVDSMTPDNYKTKIAGYQKDCPQMTVVYVDPENGRYFAEIFRQEIVKRLREEQVITTYLDNDDALNIRFVEDLQRRVVSVNNGVFINYSDGYQYYTEGNYLMKIHYPKNHFVSVVEKANPATVKGIFGYGGHYHIDEIKGVNIERVENLPLWCEVIHGRNMVNDAYFLNAKMVRESNLLRQEFAIDETVKYGARIYLFKFLPRYGRTFARRVKNRLFGMKW